MESEQIQSILHKIHGVKVAVYGDFCLDAYWIMNPDGSEVSVETGLKAEAVDRHYYSLGGASNIVHNLAILQPAEIRVIGAIGDDIFGRELLMQLEQLGINTEYLVIQHESFHTCTFVKRYLQDQEQLRIDFGFSNARSSETDRLLLAGLRSALAGSDVVIFNQQVPGSIPNDLFIEKVNALFVEFKEKIVLFDSRHYGNRFRNVYRKANDIEAAHLCGVDADKDDVITLADVQGYARLLYDQSRKPLFITRGSRGILTVDQEGVHHAPGVQLLKKLDPVGAGDTTISALALSLGAGIDPPNAARFANLAAAVTVQKLFQTGTASAKEILEIGAGADYIYQPELAEDIRQARYLSDTEIELCCNLESMPTGRMKHALFDHDGTISTLRQGWEAIMEPMMIRAILGDTYDRADETLYHKVRNRVRDYIDKSTGVQTIVQMQALVEMVCEFGVVPAGQILDALGYKQIFNEALMQMVRQRIDKLKRGQLDATDFTIKGAVAFLRTLHERGVRLYLASGTDHADVIDEAEVLGYSDLFDGGIYGSVGDVARDSKKMVIESILRDNHLGGSELVVFGDGPVELRQCRRAGGLAVGIASDEIRRHGLKTEKRTRLIKAGAHLICPDFSESGSLNNLLLGQE
ncbi:MAG: HAD hydrolase-like protein [Sedimentisphaerales bacterium]|nr:HAD hydrolase-like protein [Sedimentisphaerales bacterium]